MDGVVAAGNPTGGGLFFQYFPLIMEGAMGWMFWRKKENKNVLEIPAEESRQFWILLRAEQASPELERIKVRKLIQDAVYKLYPETEGGGFMLTFVQGRPKVLLEKLTII